VLYITVAVVTNKLTTIHSEIRIRVLSHCSQYSVVNRSFQVLHSNFYVKACMLRYRRCPRCPSVRPSVRLSVPLINSSSDVRLFYCSSGAGGLVSFNISIFAAHAVFSSRLTPRIPRTVYGCFRTYPFLLFSSSFHFVVFGFVR